MHVLTAVVVRDGAVELRQSKDQNRDLLFNNEQLTKKVVKSRKELDTWEKATSHRHADMNRWEAVKHSRAVQVLPPAAAAVCTRIVTALDSWYSRGCC